MSNEKRLNKKGFTLIEILAVIVILGILLLIAVPAINKQLADFRLKYYKKLESTVKVTGEDYMADRRYGKPTKLLYSKIIKVKDLEDEKYIDEIEDYRGNKCDNTKDSYSYVVVVKTGDKTYEYTTCLKCSEDEYATDTSGEKNDFCNVAWMTNDNIYYTDPTFDDDKLFVYYGTPEEEIRELVAFDYGIEKRDANGNVLAKVPSNGEKLYPNNISTLVNANLDQEVTLEYVLPDGSKMYKTAYVYKHYAPEVTITYTDGNLTKNIPAGQKYNEGPSEWANKLTVRMEFSNRDVKDVVDNINIKTVEYYDTSTGTWRDTGCALSRNEKSCTWTIANDFEKTIRFRIVNDRGYRSDETRIFSVKVDTTKPTCQFFNNPEYKVWRQSKTVSVGCIDSGGSSCSQNTFSVTYPTKTVYNKKTDEIEIRDNAGNTNSCPVDIYVDSTPPSTCRITATSEGRTVNDNDVLKKDVELGIVGIDDEIDASGIESNAIDVRLNGKSLGHLTTTYDKDNGQYEIVPSCRDNAGNITVGQSLHFTLDKEVRITYLGNTNTSGSMDVQVCKFNQDCKIMENKFLKTGYHFIGWKSTTTNYQPNQVIRLKSDLLLNAQWEANKYTINFAGNNNTSGSTASVVCTYDKDCTLTKNGFAKRGYTFIGWMFGGTPYGDMQVVRNLTTVNNGTVTMTAVWQVNSYKLTYDSNTGNACNPGSKVVDYGQPWGTLCTPTKTGYTFLGWYTSRTGGTEVTAKTIVDAEDITVYAHWTPNKYTINFAGNNSTSGSTPSVTCTYDQDCTLPDNKFLRTGYQFGGWTFNGKEYANKAVVRNLTSAPNGSVTLTAKWIANTYTINFAGNNNTSGSTASVTCTYDQDCTLTKNGFVRTGYTFTGWQNGANIYIDGQKVRNLTAVNKGSVTLTAIWKANSYTLTYNSQGGTACNPATKSITYDSPYGTLCTTIRTGYIFNGWFTAATGGTEVTASTTVKVTSAQTIYAHWTAITYKVAFDGNTNTSGTMATQTCRYDEECKLAVNKFVKTGYTFANWTFNNNKYNDGANVWNLSSVQDSTVTLKAAWTANSYTLTFDTTVSGLTCTPNTLRITYDSPYNKNGNLCTPSRVGYYFLGWFTEKTGGTQIKADTIVKVTANQTVYAHWTANQYTIKFAGNNNTSGTMSNIVCAYDQDCPLPDNKFLRTGYQFGGWTFNGKEYANKAVVRNLTATANATVTLTAKWIANTYTINFAGNNNTSGTTASVSCTYDQDCQLTTNGFVRTGYTFNGWLNGSNVYTNNQKVRNLTTVNKGTVTLTAIWKANGYELTYDTQGGTACDPKTKVVTYDAQYGTLCTTTRLGYIFNGWFTAATGGTQVTASTIVKTAEKHTIYAHWTAITYKVAFDGNTNTSGTMTTQTCTYDQNCKLAANKFVKTGYTFANWTFNSNKYNDGASVWNLSAVQDATVTLKAAWTANSYTLTFDSNTGNACSPNTLRITYDSAYNKNGNLCTPTKTGYHFLGWFTDKTAGTEVKATTIVKVTANQTVYAHWAPNSHRLTYNTQGGTACNPAYKDMSYDEKYGTLCTTSRTGYTFEGWYTAATGGTQLTSDTIVRGDQTLYAHWRAHKYTIKFAGNTNTSGTTANVVCTYDQNCTLTTNGFAKTGYTFSGWTYNGGNYTDKQVVKNLTATDNATVTMTAKWTANKYTINFAGNGNTSGSTASVTCTYDQDCKLTTNGFVKTGHAFGGWLNGSTVYTNGQTVKNLTATPNGSITMTAIWTTNTYTLTYNNNGGTGCVSQSSKYGSTWGTLCTPSRTGYIFNGWYTALTGGTKINGTDVVGASNVTAYAHWTPITYTIAFNANGGTGTTKSITCTYDVDCTLTANGFSKTGYTWASWSSGGKTYTNSQKVRNLTATNNATVTMTANWTANKYTLTYNSNGGTACNPTTKSITYNTQYGALCAPSRTGYIFNGWFTAASGGTQITATTTVTVTANQTIYAHWTPITYTISFNGNGNNGGTMSSISCTYDVDCTLPANAFTKTGYRFVSWTYGGNTYTNQQKVRNLIATNGANVTLTAVWNTQTYTLTYNSNGGAACSPATKTITYSAQYGALCSPSRTGYIFNGWFTAASGGSQITATTTVTVTANQTIYAHWTPITYTINFGANGGAGTTKSITCTYDVDCTLTANGFSKTGYTWSGWLYAGKTYTNSQKVRNLTTTNSGSVTLTAIWTANKYTIAFGANGGAGTTASVTCTYDVDCTLTANGFSRTGYTWQNWSYGGKTYTNQQKVKNLTTSGTITMLANWKANTYTINFGANGGAGTTKSVTCTYDVDCTLTANGFSKTGYAWSSWSYGGKTYSNGQKVRNLAASGSITLTANWTANKYTIAFNANGGAGTTASVTCTYDADCQLPANGFSKTGYQFQSWSYGGNVYTDKQKVRNLATSGTITFVANWMAMTRTLTYNSNGGAACNPTYKTGSYGSTWGALCTPSRTGYLFDGWFTAASGGTQVTTSTTITNDITVYAHWTAITYYIAFNANGGAGTTATATCRYDADCTLTTNGFSKSGYSWGGWSYGGGVYSQNQKVRNLTASHGGTITMYAIWNANTYTLTYNSNGGSACSPASKTGTYGSTWGTLCTPSRTGYIFDGWYTAASGGTKISAIVSGSITVYAHWTPITYYVAFSANGGAGTTATATCRYDTDCTLTTNGFSKSGYVWAGWSYGGGVYSQNQKVRNLTATNGGTVTMTAIWNPATYYLTYDSNGGWGCYSQAGTYGKTWGTLCTPTRYGYTFNGWFSGSTQLTASTVVYGNASATARWTANKYTISFNGNGASGGSTPSVTCTYDVACTLPNNGFYKAYNLFSSWSYNGATYNNGSSVKNLVGSGTVTLWANWNTRCYARTNSQSYGYGTCDAPYSSSYNCNIYTGCQTNACICDTYRITFNNNGGSGCGTKDVYIGSQYGSMCTPSRAGYRFDGWYTAASGGSAVSASTIATGNVTVYAHWSALRQSCQVSTCSKSVSATTWSCSSGGTCGCTFGQTSCGLSSGRDGYTDYTVTCYCTYY